MPRKKEISLVGLEILGPKPMAPLSSLRLSFSDKTSLSILITSLQKRELVKRGVVAEVNELLEGKGEDNA